MFCPWDRKRRLRVLAALHRLAASSTEAEPGFFKRFVAGALNAAAGKLTWVGGTSKASALFQALAIGR